MFAKTIFERLMKRLLLVGVVAGIVLAGIVLAGSSSSVSAAGWAVAGIPRPPADQASFLAYLSQAGQPGYSRKNRYPANFQTFHDYKLLVYGTPSQVPGNRYSATYRQYAMLGFSYDERPVTNSLFPDDAPGGITQSTPFRWAELDLGQAAADSWQRLGEARRRTLKSTQLFYRGEPFGYMNYSNLGLSERKAIVLAPPSWHLGSALYTEHNIQRSGYKEKRYATFTCNGSGGATLSCDIEILTPPESSSQAYAFEHGQDELRIAYRVTGRIEALNGLASDGDIVLRGAGTDDGHVLGSDWGPFVYEGVRTIHRSALVGASAGVGEIKATAFVVSAMGDIVLQEQVRYLPLRSQKAVQPLTVEAGITGAIGFFSGAPTLAGRTFAASGRRFLGLETVWLNVRFSKPVRSWQYTFQGLTHMIAGAENQLDFSVPLRMPLNCDTLSWQDNRLQPALEIRIDATGREAPEQSAQAVLSGIELTGDIYDLLYLQTAN